MVALRCVKVSRAVLTTSYTRKAERSRAQGIATQVVDAYKVRTLSSQHTNEVKQFGQFKKPSVPKNV